MEVEMGEVRKEEFNDSMCVEWAKVRARMLKWQEELLIMQEEMRQVIAYHMWKVAWWREMGSLRTNSDLTILSGLLGYAHRQAAIHSRMAEQCVLHWLLHLKSRGIMPLWAVDYESLLSQVQTYNVQDNEEYEDMMPDNIEGNKHEELDFGDGDEIDSGIEDEDDDDLDWQ
jgi:hypothetical protein